MSARIIDGKAHAEALRGEIARDVEAFRAATGVVPRLAAVLVGNDPASAVYVRNKERACARVGIASTIVALPATTQQAELLETLHLLNRDAAVHGILVQLPLPRGLDEMAIIQAMEPLKDVDAFHPINVGLISIGKPRFLPCTPAGVEVLLQRAGVAVAGADVVIVGRSNLVGKPLAMMLSQKGVDATVTICHSRSRDLATHTRRADIVVAALGQPEFITGAMLKPGAVVVDVGINRLPDGRMVGDVHFASAAEVASQITPVPGGVGMMTVTLLLANTLKAAQLQWERNNPTASTQVC